MIFTSRSHVATAVLAFTAALLFPLLAQAGIEEHIIQTESGFYYTVQKGDTLWDLSKKFYDSAWQWPDLWHYNPKIGNPHLIYPGQRIKIYEKSWEEMQKPQPAATVKPALPRPARHHLYSAINALGFIRESAVEPAGTVFKAKEDKQLISTGDKIYIRPGENGNLSQGSFYTVYRTSGPILHPETNDAVGIQHHIAGVVEITEIKPDFATGEIKETFIPIQNGDMLMPFLTRSEKIAFADPVPGLSGKVIKGENGEIMIGEHAIAFIDKGNRDGVKPGQAYRVSYVETTGTTSLFSKPVALMSEYLGSLLVLHTEETTSSVLITNSVGPIAPGQTFDPFETEPGKTTVHQGE